MVSFENTFKSQNDDKLRRLGGPVQILAEIKGFSQTIDSIIFFQKTFIASFKNLYVVLVDNY